LFQETQAQPEQIVCRHHWIIQPANGPFSLGLCRFCLEEREFRNSVEGGEFGGMRIQAASLHAFEPDRLHRPDREH